MLPSWRRGRWLLAALLAGCLAGPLAASVGATATVPPNLIAAHRAAYADTVNVLTDPTLRRRPTNGVAAYRTLIRHEGDPSGHHLVRHPVASDCAFVEARDRPVCLQAAT